MSKQAKQPGDGASLLKFLFVVGIAAVILAAGVQGVHQRNVCSLTKNAALCELAFEAGMNEADAISEGNL